MSDHLKVTPLTAPPPHLSPEEHEAATSSTPESFANIPPKLVLALEGAVIYADPPLQDVQQETGQVWVTEQSFSFLSQQAALARGFSLPYPLIALHAVSSSVPEALSSLGQRQCVYCQIDDSSSSQQDEEGAEDLENEDEMGLREVWIVPFRSEDVEALFGALSHCASLHPSALEDDGGNPFAGMGPFGTGANGSGLDSNQFDDADEAVVDVDENGLSETGRAQLSRLDALLTLDGDDDSSEGDGEGYRSDDEIEGPSHPRVGTPVEDGAGAPPPRSTVQQLASATHEDTNLLLLSSHPLPIPSLFSPPLLQSLLALLDAYAPVVGWDPNPEKGEMRVVFDDRPSSTEARGADSSSISSGIVRIIDTLSGLPLETDEEDYAGPPPALSVRPLERIDVTRLLPSQLSGPLPTISLPNSQGLDSSAGSHISGHGGKHGTGATPRFQPTDHLLPPSTDRNFLISPPGSPPIGWEPIREDPPNRETLALDLMEALRNLSRDMDAASAAGDDDSEQGIEGPRAEGGSLSGTGLPAGSDPVEPPVQVVIPADEHAAATGPGAGSLPVPAVTVQSFDSPALSSSGDVSPQKKRDITMVKATVESMRGDSEQGSRGDEGTSALIPRPAQGWPPRPSAPFQAQEVEKGSRPPADHL